GDLRVFVHDAADAVADVLMHDAEAGRLGVLLHAQGDLRPPLAAAQLRHGDLQHLLAHLDQPAPLRADLADDNRGRRVRAPAVELAGGVDLDQIALADHAGAGNAVDDLLVEGDAGRGGKGYAARVALEERLGVMLGEQGFDGAVDVDGLDARLDRLAANAQG